MFEAAFGKSMFSVLQKYFSGEGNVPNLYTILVFNEFKISRQMGVALVVNELIKQQDADEIATVACLSRIKNIQSSFQRYGNLYNLLKGHKGLVIVWQLKPDLRQQ